MEDRIAFVAFGAVALTGAANVITRRDPVHCALWLVGALLGVAGLYLTLRAGFLGGVQVAVYAGAIMLLFLFVIMLLNLGRMPFEGLSAVRPASALAALTACALVVFPLLRDRQPAAPAAPMLEAPATIANVAGYLHTQYLLPFEIVSLLLLTAMIGSIHLGRRPRPTEVP